MQPQLPLSLPPHGASRTQDLACQAVQAPNTEKDSGLFLNIHALDSCASCED